MLGRDKRKEDNQKDKMLLAQREYARKKEKKKIDASSFAMPPVNSKKKISKRKRRISKRKAYENLLKNIVWTAMAFSLLTAAAASAARSKSAPPTTDKPLQPEEPGQLSVYQTPTLTTQTLPTENNATLPHSPLPLMPTEQSSSTQEVILQNTMGSMPASDNYLMQHIQSLKNELHDYVKSQLKTTYQQHGESEHSMNYRKHHELLNRRIETAFEELEKDGELILQSLKTARSICFVENKKKECYDANSSKADKRNPERIAKEKMTEKYNKIKAAFDFPYADFVHFKEIIEQERKIIQKNIYDDVDITKKKFKRKLKKIYPTRTAFNDAYSIVALEIQNFFYGQTMSVQYAFEEFLSKNKDNIVAEFQYGQKKNDKALPIAKEISDAVLQNKKQFIDGLKHRLSYTLTEEKPNPQSEPEVKENLQNELEPKKNPPSSLSQVQPETAKSDLPFFSYSHIEILLATVVVAITGFILTTIKKIFLEKPTSTIAFTPQLTKPDEVVIKELPTVQSEITSSIKSEIDAPQIAMQNKIDELNKKIDAIKRTLEDVELEMQPIIGKFQASKSYADQKIQAHHTALKGAIQRFNVLKNDITPLLVYANKKNDDPDKVKDRISIESQLDNNTYAIDLKNSCATIQEKDKRLTKALEHQPTFSPGRIHTVVSATTTSTSNQVVMADSSKEPHQEKTPQPCPSVKKLADFSYALFRNDNDLRRQAATSLTKKMRPTEIKKDVKAKKTIIQPKFYCEPDSNSLSIKAALNILLAHYTHLKELNNTHYNVKSKEFEYLKWALMLSLLQLCNLYLSLAEGRELKLSQEQLSNMKKLRLVLSHSPNSIEHEDIFNFIATLEEIQLTTNNTSNYQSCLLNALEAECGDNTHLFLVLKNFSNRGVITEMIGKEEALPFLIEDLKLLSYIYCDKYASSAPNEKSDDHLFYPACRMLIVSFTGMLKNLQIDSIHISVFRNAIAHDKKGELSVENVKIFFNHFPQMLAELDERYGETIANDYTQKILAAQSPGMRKAM